MRRVVDPGRIFELRLGALYLTLLLHESQPQRPRQPVPVLEVRTLVISTGAPLALRRRQLAWPLQTNPSGAPLRIPTSQGQWHGFERMVSEVRLLRHADGFAALHALWAGNRIEHWAGERPSVNRTDVHSEVSNERGAQLLVATKGVDELGPSPHADQLREVLPAIFEREAAYEKALEAAFEAGADGRPAGWPLGDSVVSRLQSELGQYRSGARWAAPPDYEDAAAAPGARDALGLGATHRRRQAVRQRPYAPGRPLITRSRRCSLTDGDGAGASSSGPPCLAEQHSSSSAGDAEEEEEHGEDDEDGERASERVSRPGPAAQACTQGGAEA